MQAFLIFTGTNARAWTVLARYFEHNSVPYYLVAANKDDAVFDTDFARRVLFTRDEKHLIDDDILAVGQALEESGVGAAFLCPTSEFINSVYFEKPEIFGRAGITLAAADKAIYEKFTNKSSSYALFDGGEVRIAAEYSQDEIEFPCIAKPRENFTGGSILYPQFLMNARDFRDFSERFAAEDYFFEEYLDGESFYLCLYFSKDGRVAKYAQRNLAQQPGGKSIVSAEECGIGTLPVAAEVIRKFEGEGYRGPAMVELYRKGQDWYFIEVNPRFWGPLLLAYSACPDLLALYVKDWLGLDCTSCPEGPQQYLWYKGGMDTIDQLRLYSDDILDAATHFDERRQCDVFNFPDTQSLAFKN